MKCDDLMTGGKLTTVDDNRSRGVQGFCVLQGLGALLLLSCVASASDGATVALRVEAAALNPSGAARAVSIEVFVDSAEPSPTTISAHQIRVVLQRGNSGISIVTAGAPQRHQYVGPSIAPVAAISPSQVDAGDIAFVGSTNLSTGAGLLRVELAVPGGTSPGLYPVAISSNPQFSFVANATGDALPMSVSSGGIRIGGRQGDFDFDSDVDGADLLTWQRQLGATGVQAADGDGSGHVDATDLVLWRSHFGDGRQPGDYDQNGVVDGADLLRWQRAFGSLVDLGPDGNVNGIVDKGDFAIWREHFGEGTRIRVSGDYNGDSRIDGADMLVWQRDQGSTTRLSADGNQNGIVDAPDLAIWRSAFGQSGSTYFVAQVPEPTAEMLLLVGWASYLPGRRDRRIVSSIWPRSSPARREAL